MKFVFLYVTATSKEEALKISSSLLEERLIACVNMFPIKSMYLGNDKIAKKNEYVLILKTEKGAVPLISKKIAKMHSYSIPCITEVSAEPNEE